MSYKVSMHRHTAALEKMVKRLADDLDPATRARLEIIIPIYQRLYVP